MKMFVINKALILIIINLILCGGTCVDNRSKTIWEMLLQNDLMDNYNVFEPPNKNDVNCSRVEVELIMGALQIKFDSDNGVMTIYSKIYTLWKDQRLTWDPLKYANISYTYISNTRIWKPELTFFDTRYHKIDHSLCHLRNNHTVVCSRIFIHEVGCVLRVSNWPYDRQKCALAIGAAETSPITLKYLHGNISLPKFAPQAGGGWDLIDITSESQESLNSVSIEFVVQRRSNVASNFIIIPCLALTILTLTTLTLDIQDSVRLFLLCFSLMWHFFFLSFFGELIPSKSLDSPSILLYFRGSVIVTTLNIMSLFILNVIRKRETELPSWISNANNYVYSSPIKCILPVINEGEKWNNFAKVLNVVIVVVTVLVYFSLYIAYMPSPE